MNREIGDEPINFGVPFFQTNCKTLCVFLTVIFWECFKIGFLVSLFVFLCFFHDLPPLPGLVVT